MGGYLTDASNVFRQPVFQDLPREDPAPPAPVDAELELPEGPQSEDVRRAVNATIDPDATVQQRNTAYREVQAYVDRAQGSDHTLIDDATMRGIAVYVQGEHGVPTKYRQEVVDAVDRELAPTATLAQQAQAYEEIQRYVDGVGGIGDAGIVADALPARASTLLEEAGLPTVASQARAEAERILDVGVRDDWRPGNQQDDYGARFDAYSQAVSGQSEAFREHLNAALLASDPGAVKSWLTPSALVAAHNDGDIDDAGFASATESIAKAYNDGVIDGDSFDSGYERGPINEQIGNGQTLLDFLDGSSGPETVELRADLAQKALDAFYPESFKAGATFEGGVYVQLNMALRIAAGDPQHPEILTDLLLDQSEENRNTILSVAGQLGARENENYGYEDAMAVIFDAVANDDRPEASELAASLARLPGQHADWFGTDQEPRNDALTRMFEAHSKTILDNLTVYDRTAAGSSSDSNRQAYDVNVDALGELFGLILFNPDAPDAAVVQATVQAYAGDLTASLNTLGDDQSDVAAPGQPFAGENSEDLVGRLAVLSAGTSAAITDQWNAIREDEEARKAAIGFVVDLALAAVPVGDLASGRVKAALANILPEGAIRTAVEGLSGQIVDEATGRLTDDAKQQLADALGADQADAIEQSALQDALEQALVAGVEDNTRRGAVVERADRLTGDN